MTARPPIPARPRLGTRLAYVLQRMLRPRVGVHWLSARIESSGLARTLFTKTEQLTKETLFGCRMCGQCALPVTGYVCPMGCPKELRNGPCGGVGADGGCEVYPERRCVWVEAYERAASQGRAGRLDRGAEPAQGGPGPQDPLQAVRQADPQARMRGNGRPGGQQTVRAGVNCAR